MQDLKFIIPYASLTNAVQILIASFASGVAIHFWTIGVGYLLSPLTGSMLKKQSIE